MFHQFIKIISLVTIIITTIAHSKDIGTPDGLSIAEWQNIQKQINSKSALQTNATLDQNYLKASNVDANDTIANGGDGGDAFGISVDIDGDTLVVGARYENGAGDTINNSGAAYVFIKSNGAWVQQGDPLRASNPNTTDQLGMSVGISGDTIVVGSRLGESEVVNSGTAYVYTRTAGVWSFQTLLKASNPSAFDQFGFTIAIDSGTIVVGAYQEDGSSSSDNYGAAYIFTGSGNSWSQQAMLTAAGLGTGIGIGDNFGYSVSISGDTVVIGAYKEDGLDDATQDDSGAAYVFVRTGTSWSPQAYLKASNVGTSDNFGVSVSISGNSIVVGATGEDGDSNSINSTGAAYVFTRSGTTWSEQSILRATNAGNGDFFGSSVAIDSNKIVIGAKFENGDGIDGLDNNNAFNSGAAYLFERNGVMVQQTYLKASNADAFDEFGISVAISGNTVVVGAHGENSAFSNMPDDNTFSPDPNGAGATYIFSPGDMMFADGFEQAVVVKLFQYLSKIQSNTNLDQYPVYDGKNNSLVFYGHSLKLKNNYDKQDIVEIVKFWLHEVLIEEGLSGQLGLDVIFE